MGRHGNRKVKTKKLNSHKHKTSGVAKCSRGMKNCKNKGCEELLYIHKSVCTRCSFINDQTQNVTHEEKDFLQSFIDSKRPEELQMKKNLSRIQKTLRKLMYESDFFLDKLKIPQFKNTLTNKEFFADKDERNSEPVESPINSDLNLEDKKKISNKWLRARYWDIN